MLLGERRQRNTGISNNPETEGWNAHIRVHCFCKLIQEYPATGKVEQIPWLKLDSVRLQHAQGVCHRQTHSFRKETCIPHLSLSRKDHIPRTHVITAKGGL